MSGKRKLPPSPRPGARYWVRVQRPKDHDDEFGEKYRWEPDAEDELWDAHDALVEHNDARPLVRALLSQGRLPAKVRQGFQLWLDGKLPPHPKLKAKDYAVWQAARAYHQTPPLPRAPGEEFEEHRWRQAKRVLETQPLEQPGAWRKAGATPQAVLRVVDCDGSQYLKIRSWRDAVDAYRGVRSPSRKQYKF
jgi:hypothetical protein